ncbi:MAG: flagellar biosynthesis protein FlgL [Lachnospira sp.]|nr:flagellar biosynthesis protein FlgL [Lachnospira sp.]
MRINTNISAIITNNRLQSAQDKLALSLERLSSGKKINKSADDAAGMAISQKMAMQLRGLDQADKNAQDGISVVQTAEGGLNEVHSILQRMRELAVQAANGIYSPDERVALQNEVDALKDEVDRISRDTDFNTQALLDGGLARRVYPDMEGFDFKYCSEKVDADIYGLTVDVDARQAVYESNAIDTTTLTGGITEELAGRIIINGEAMDFEVGDTFDTVMSKLSEVCEYASINLMGVASLDTTAGTYENAGYTPVSMEPGVMSNLVMVTVGYGTGEKIDVSFSNEKLANALGLTERIEGGRNAEVSFATDANGELVGFTETATIRSYGNSITITDIGGFEMQINLEDNLVGQTTMIDVTDMGRMTVHVGANENQIMDIDIPEMSANALAIEHINIRTSENAGRSITTLDTAIARVSEARSRLGAYQNRLEHTVSNLSVSTENLTTSLSRIEDTDMAEEMTNYTQLNVLSQAGVSMLSQANARPESVLQLLQK